MIKNLMFTVFTAFFGLNLQAATADKELKAQKNITKKKKRKNKKNAVTSNSFYTKTNDMHIRSSMDPYNAQDNYNRDYLGKPENPAANEDKGAKLGAYFRNH